MTLSEQKRLVGRFLRRCNRYADDKLAGYREQLAGAAGFEALELQDKISHWTAYKTFNEYTIDELEGTDRLDAWLDARAAPRD